MSPWTIVSASYQRQARHTNVTEIVAIPNRGHSLTIDSGWKRVAEIAADFVQQYVPAA